LETRSGTQAERLFADLCNRRFLRGFVFHSPRCFNPTESEVGDVVLWVRRKVVTFEVIAKVADKTGTKQFVKRIGQKRDQLVNDFKIFNDPNLQITMVNENAETVAFDKEDVNPFRFAGIVIVDCTQRLEKMHYGTIEKTLGIEFPIAFMTRQDFLDLAEEIDTIPDLVYYLFDRSEFLKAVYPPAPSHFLDLNLRLER